MTRNDRMITGLILVVDDEWITREMMQALLESDGHQVMLAHSGEQALEVISRQLPDLVLTDVRMPGMKGPELCARLKSEESTQHIPVVLISALGEEEDQRRGIDAGAADFVSKPLNTLIMLNRVRTLLSIKRQRDLLLARDAQIRHILSRHLDAATTETIMRELAQEQASPI